jgi:hypothetical protein
MEFRQAYWQDIVKSNLIKIILYFPGSIPFFMYFRSLQHFLEILN